MTDQPAADKWMTIRDAAAALGTSEGAVRNRIKRRTLRSRRDNNGRVMVLVAAAHTADRPIIADPLASHGPPTGRPTNRGPATGSALAALAEAHRQTLEVVTAAHAGEIAALKMALEEARARADTEARRADAAEVALRAAQTQTGMLTWFLDVFRRTKPG